MRSRTDKPMLPPRRRGEAAGGSLMREVCSPENLAQAWRKVRANKGGPGVDGECLGDFERNLRANLDDLRRSLLRGAYRPQMVRRAWIPKASGGMRPLAILAIRDRIAQRAVYNVLAPRFERAFLDCSYGFREGRSLHDAAEAVARWRDAGREWVIDGDIKNCFENLDHELLLQLLDRELRDPPLVELLQRWLKARIFNDLQGAAPAAGTFQGGVLSPLLCNVYLHPFDTVLTRLGLALVRYADDWVVLCARKAEAEAGLRIATETLARLRLVVNPHKTRIVHFSQGFAFLGVFFLRNERYFVSPGAAVTNERLLGSGGDARAGKLS